MIRPKNLFSYKLKIKSNIARLRPVNHSKYYKPKDKIFKNRYNSLKTVRKPKFVLESMALRDKSLIALTNIEI